MIPKSHLHKKPEWELLQKENNGNGVEAYRIIPSEPKGRNSSRFSIILRMHGKRAKHLGNLAERRRPLVHVVTPALLYNRDELGCQRRTELMAVERVPIGQWVSSAPLCDGD